MSRGAIARNFLQPTLGVMSAESNPVAFYTAAYFLMAAIAIFALYWLLQATVPQALPALSVERSIELIPKLRGEYIEIFREFDQPTAAWYVQAYAGSAVLAVTMLALFWAVLTPMILFLGSPVHRPPTFRGNAKMLGASLGIAGFVYWFPSPHDPREHFRILWPNASGLLALDIGLLFAFLLLALQCIVLCQLARYGITRWRASEVSPTKPERQAEL